MVVSPSFKANKLSLISGRISDQNCLALLQLCSSFPTLSQLHTLILKLGLLRNPFVLAKFASVSSDLHSVHYASSVLFSSDSDPYLYDTFLFNTLIRGYARTSSSEHNAFRCYRLMRELGVCGNRYTYPFLIKACAGLAELGLCQQVHRLVLRLGFEDNVHVQNTTIHMYCCCGGGGIVLARKVFDEMPKSNSVPWSAMIGWYARLGMAREAVGLFRKMQLAGVRPDEITMVSVLSACIDLGSLELGNWLETCIEKENV